MPRHTASSACDREPAGAHQVHGGAVAAAAAREAAPRSEQLVLARREEPRARTHVLDEQQLPVRAEHACDLAERAFGVVDGAKDQRRDDGVHRRVGQR